MAEINMTQEILTQEGARELEQELEYLKTVGRKQVAEKIRVAREFGDISENAEYDEAKNEQSRIEGRIAELEKKLRNASVIDDNMINTNSVSIGSTVTVMEAKTGETMDFTIVGSTEVNPLQGKISNKSPVGAALLGAAKGDTVSIKTPDGVIEYKIVEIKRN